METGFEFWRLAAGLGLFLFGMHQLELALAALAGRPFKRFLKDSTEGPVRGVVAGAVATAALQSSSVVSLIVLAFVGSGLISLPSALAIVFGSNVGTTVTGWIVATVGFKLDIEALSLPLIALGGLAVVWSVNHSTLRKTGMLLAGFGLMLLGLDFMKSGAEATAGLFDPARLAGYPLLVFLVAGLAITAIIQSSSATILIALSALYVGAIPLPAAAAIAIGADLGTTITAVLGAFAGSADKKRVVLAILIFNVAANAVALILIHPLLGFVQSVLGLSDPLLALVAFHSMFNLIGVIAFLPLIKPLSRWLESRFVGDSAPLLRHIKPGIIDVAEAAVESTVRETLRLIDQAGALNLAQFDLPTTHHFYEPDSDRAEVEVFERRPDLDRSYGKLKELEGAILGYALALQRGSLDKDESEKLARLVPALRNAVHSAKSMRDIDHDLERFRDSVNDRFNAYADRFREVVRTFYEAASHIDANDDSRVCFERLVTSRNTTRDLHASMHRRIFDEVESGELSRDEISTLLNVNREIYASNRGLLMALADALLDETSAEDFASLPETA